MLYVLSGVGGGGVIQPSSHEVLVIVVAAFKFAVIVEVVFLFRFQTAAGEDGFLFLLSAFGFFLQGKYHVTNVSKDRLTLSQN